MKFYLIYIIFLLFIKINVQSQSYIKVDPLSFNTPDFSEIGPALYKNGLFYTSNKKTTTIQSKKTKENEYFYNIFFHNENKSLKTLVDTMLNKINTPFHDGPMATFGDTFIVSKNYNLRGGKKHKAPVGLFFYDFSMGKTIPICKPFPYNHLNYRVGHPTITPDGKYLFFTSNIPGGFGGFDIYISEKQDTTWTKPINLGPNINSEKDEITPYIIANRLYFSSNRDSIKNFDVYFSELENNQWTVSQCLPHPINSEYNDFSFICDSTFEQGYFASNRKKTDDIYRFYSTLPVFESCDTMIEKNLCFHFLDETSQYLDTLPVIFEWDFGDGNTIQAWEAEHCYADYGNYFVKLTMIDTITNDIQEVATYTLNIERIAQPYITFADTIFHNQITIFDSAESYYPNGKIQHFIWTFSDGYKHIGSTCERMFKKPGKYWVKLGYIAIDEFNNEIKKCSILEFNVY